MGAAVRLRGHGGSAVSGVPASRHPALPRLPQHLTRPEGPHSHVQYGFRYKSLNRNSLNRNNNQYKQQHEQQTDRLAPTFPYALCLLFGLIAPRSAHPVLRTLWMLRHMLTLCHRLGASGASPRALLLGASSDSRTRALTGGIMSASCLSVTKICALALPETQKYMSPSLALSLSLCLCLCLSLSLSLEPKGSLRKTK